MLENLPDHWICHFYTTNNLLVNYKYFLGVNELNFNLIFFLANIKAQKVRSPVIEDRAWDENRVVQSPVPKTILKKGFIHFNLFRV